MTINFHDPSNSNTYSAREADPNWKEMIRNITPVSGKHVADIGCGGGIYTNAFLQMGASHVTAVDYSEAMLKGARQNCADYDQITFVHGDAFHTGLEDGSIDLVLERALIHHIQDLTSCFSECFRILKPGGILIVQDRTPEDCFLPGSKTHIRGYLFERFPKLMKKESSRRHQSIEVINALDQAGFQEISAFPFWETRRIYQDFNELSSDLRARTGRSIMHELSDVEIEELVQYLDGIYHDQDGKIVEQDRWTIWLAKKPLPNIANLSGNIL